MVVDHDLAARIFPDAPRRAERGNNREDVRPHRDNRAWVKYCVRQDAIARAEAATIKIPYRNLTDHATEHPDAVRRRQAADDQAREAEEKAEETHRWSAWDRARAALHDDA